MDDLLPILLATQVSASLAALGIALKQWHAMKSAAKELKAKLTETTTSKEDVESLLAQLSLAESEGTAAMEAAISQNGTSIAKAVEDLTGAKRTMVLKALTQPSDARRKRFVYDLTPSTQVRN